MWAIKNWSLSVRHVLNHYQITLAHENCHWTHYMKIIRQSSPESEIILQWWQGHWSKNSSTIDGFQVLIIFFFTRNLIDLLWKCWQQSPWQREIWFSVTMRSNHFCGVNLLSPKNSRNNLSLLKDSPRIFILVYHRMLAEKQRKGTIVFQIYIFKTLRQT